MVFMYRLVLFATDNMSGKPQTNFPQDGHHTVVIGTDPIVKLMNRTKIKWSCCGTFRVP